MLISLCKSLVTISRRTNLAIDSQSVAASISVSSAPDINCTLNFIFSVSQTGTITITGVLDGSPQSETILVSANKIASGVKYFSSVTSVAFDSSILSAGGTVTVKFIGGDGGSVSSTSTIASGYPMQIDRGKEDLYVPQSGSNPVEQAKGYLPYTEVLTPKEADIITLERTNVQFLVTGNPFIEEIGFTSFWKLNLQKYENNN